MLFDAEIDPYWEDARSFLGDFYNEILHQDTCQPATVEVGGRPACWAPAKLDEWFQDAQSPLELRCPAQLARGRTRAGPRTP
ncbi:hypothetical protein [Streptomyces sp. NPDC025273]|uniref:hypothetical protein n=1 Tax=unclassified Streptomyces TaxID=2593676 RepID=UPI0033DCF49B